MNRFHRSGWACACLLIGCVLFLSPVAIGLTDRDFQALNRYQVQAEEAIGQGDPNGAALTIGRAALLAAQLGGNSRSKPTNRLEHVLASFYRTQEHTYRAIALFQQSGSQPPASRGVCQTLEQGQQQAIHTTHLYHTLPLEEKILPTLPQQFSEWEEMIQEIKRDLRCVK